MKLSVKIAALSFYFKFELLMVVGTLNLILVIQMAEQIHQHLISYH